MSTVASQSFGVTLWLVPPDIFVTVAVRAADRLFPSPPGTSGPSSSALMAAQNRTASSMAFFESHGALACELSAALTRRLIASLPLYAMVTFVRPLGSPNTA